MRKPLIALGISVGALLHSTQPALASFTDGNDLLRSCETPESDRFHHLEVANCMGYILGAYDALSLPVEGREPMFCPPTGLVAKQVYDLVIQYLKDNPKNRHYPAGGLMLMALSDAFPCRSNQK